MLHSDFIQANYCTLLESLKDTRQKLAYTQLEVSKKLNVSLRTYQDFENTKSINWNLLFKLSEIWDYRARVIF